jgi:hypothetical protein
MPHIDQFRGKKNVGKGDGDIGHQGWLVGFGREQVIAASVPDELVDGTLAERRAPVMIIPSNDKTLSRTKAAVISLASGGTRN